jgi:SAM-dependent methyltransferase
VLYLSDPAERFRYVEPPFQLNAPEIARYPVEVTGYHLLRSLRRRLGWNSFEGKRVLDLGCGVRFARTIYNLDLAFGLYAGIDTDPAPVAWLAEHLRGEPHFRFAHLDMHQNQYNPSGQVVRDRSALRVMGFTDFDAACMFSVITHQLPDDTRAIFAMLREAVGEGGRLYFTAFTDETIERFDDRDPRRPAHYAVYHPEYLRELAAETGWAVEDVHAKSDLQQTAFVCRTAAR